jgi:hypothetical protein
MRTVSFDSAGLQRRCLAEILLIGFPGLGAALVRRTVPLGARWNTVHAACYFLKLPKNRLPLLAQCLLVALLFAAEPILGRNVSNSQHMIIVIGLVASAASTAAWLMAVECEDACPFPRVRRSRCVCGLVPGAVWIFCKLR